MLDTVLPRVTVVVGNPRPGSRTLDAAQRVAKRLTQLIPNAEPVATIDLATQTEALLEWNGSLVQRMKHTILESSALVVATPTYKASYTGILKLFLDQFEAGELGHLPTVPLMTGGSDVHSLAVDVHLTPLLLEIGASIPVRGLFIGGRDVDQPGVAVERWFDPARQTLTRALSAPSGT